jgi:hypothetical protein
MTTATIRTTSASRISAASRSLPVQSGLLSSVFFIGKTEYIK